MSKEKEALEPSVVLKFVDGLLKRYEGKTDYNIYITKDWLLEIKQSLQRLESIDNAEPSEALKCLEKLLDGYSMGMAGRSYYDTIKQALLKAQTNARSEEILQKYYQEGITLDSVRELKQERDNYKKILEIIKEKKVELYLLRKSEKVEEYNAYFLIDEYQVLTQEEFNLLKEVLG